VVEAEGINYFGYFQERLSQKARRYRVDVMRDSGRRRGSPRCCTRQMWR
jgi:hypothetical protein